MPFICENTTLPNPNCSPLLEYCNDNFGIVKDWCNCMVTAQIRGCRTDTNPMIIIIILVSILIGVPCIACVFVCLYSAFTVYKNKKNVPKDVPLIPN
jgi:hypothetical protein